jgi:sulfotransferase
MRFIPQTGLPRSGSTLLLYILNQNPIFKIGPDSEIGQILNVNREFMKTNLFHFQLPHEEATKAFYSFCRNGTYSWIDEICDSDKIFIDKSRHWFKNIDYIFKVFPDIKILVTIRDLRGIVNSFERIHNNSLASDKTDYYQNLNEDLQFQRIKHILNLNYVSDGLFTLKELLEVPKKFKDKLFIVRYEDLTSNSEQTLNQIYDFLNLPKFNHDFMNIQQEKYYNDNPYQPYGDHKIKSKVIHKKETFSEVRSDLLNEIIREYNWYYKNYYPDF